MDQATVIEKTILFVKEKLENETSGHDWEHIKRVWENTKLISKSEDVDLFICEMAALLHDLVDDKLFSDENKAIEEVKAWLVLQNVSEEAINHIMEIITTMSFKGGNNDPVQTLEGQVVQDADRLDAIGAIGIARCFVYAGNKGDPIYDEQVAVREQMSKEEYRSGHSSAINHFYEKLLKLKDLMNTDTGKGLAENRHRFMEQFLSQFFGEINGEQ